MSLRSVVVPAAGLGTRFLPATKAQPKEMMTIVDRPLIQYAVEEAVAAGVSRVVLVSAPGRGSLQDHFCANARLEDALERSGRQDLLAVVRRVESLAAVQTVVQPEPRGVGHAILMAREAVEEGAFGVMFPDDLIIADVPVLEQLRRVHERTGGIVLAVQRVAREQVHRYGVIRGTHAGEGLYRVEDLIEKPRVEEAPSDLAIVGRYILPDDVFLHLQRTEPGVGGEIQLTDALRAALATLPCHALEFEGDRHDCGGRLGFLQATVEIARRHPELGPEFERYLAEVVG